MREREATWEKRNLGVECHEFFVDKDEAPEDVFDSVLACKAEYQALHVQWGNTEVLLEAQKNGFSFLETAIDMELDARKMTVPKMYSRFAPHLSYKIADEAEIQQVINLIKSGEMFTTDKIARDPYFGAQNSGYRYALWLEDVIRDGAKILLINYKDITIGFNTALLNEDGAVRALLGGRFPQYDDTGLGFAPLLMILQWMLDVGGKRMITSMSSNNLPIVRMHEEFGFHIKGMTYILVKHL